MGEPATAQLLPNRRGLDQTLFSTTPTSCLPHHWTQNIVPRVRIVGLKYTIEKIIDFRLGELLENPLIQRHERVIRNIQHSELLHQRQPF